jgi:hypothetical protein
MAVLRRIRTLFTILLVIAAGFAALVVFPREMTKGLFREYTVAKQLHQRGVPAQSTVVSAHHEDGGSDSGTTYYSTVVYQTDGATHRQEISVDSDYHPGDEIDVVYDPVHPDTVRMAGAVTPGAIHADLSHAWIGVVVFAFIGLLLLPFVLSLVGVIPRSVMDEKDEAEEDQAAQPAG